MSSHPRCSHPEEAAEAKYLRSSKEEDLAKKFLRLPIFGYHNMLTLSSERCILLQDFNTSRIFKPAYDCISHSYNTTQDCGGLFTFDFLNLLNL